MKRTSREIHDELLAIRCRQRDVAAWDELVTRWNDRLFYYLRRLIEDEQEATNVLQDVWLRAIRGIHSLRDGSRLAPWLYTIARRTAMDHFRQTYANLEESASELVANETVEGSEQEVELDNVELVHFGLGQLGIAEREVLTLFFLEDLTLKEIAELLDVAVGTVKSRLFRARRDIRRVIERESRCHE
jgi:RNA polymerase sigma-70 factor (ECF subfamily)